MTNEDAAHLRVWISDPGEFTDLAYEADRLLRGESEAEWDFAP